MAASIPYLGEIASLGSAFVWAGAVILFKRTSDAVHPIALNVFKNLLALVLFPLTIFLTGASIFPDYPVRFYLLLILSGVMGMGMADTLFLMAVEKLGASLLAIVSTLYAPIVVGLSMVWLGERLTLLQWLGIVLILTAVLMVTVRQQNGNTTRKNVLLGVLFSVGSSVVMGVSVILVKPILEETPILWATQMRLAGGIFFLSLTLLLHPKRWAILGTLNNKAIMKYMIPGSVMGAYLALLLLLVGLKYALASVSTVLNQTSNLFIFVLAALLLREKATPVKIVGILLGVAGAVLVTFG